MVGGVMYFASQKNRVIALGSKTGKELWTYYPKTPSTSEHRGVSFWTGDKQHPPRVILATAARLIDLDAKTGKPVPEFGDNGEVNLGAREREQVPRRCTCLTSC